MNSNQTMMSETDYIQSLYIDAKPEKVWKKITTVGVILPYYHNAVLLTDNNILQKDTSITYEVDGRKVIQGKITEIIPGEKLQHTFRFVRLDDSDSLVTWNLRPEGSGSRLELVHEQLTTGSQTESDVKSDSGWKLILSGLKKLTES